jgi:replicative DNA helicase
MGSIKYKNIKPFDEISFSQEQPQGKDLEEAVLGGILLEQDIMDTIAKDFSENLFYVEANKVIAKAILDMYQKGDKIDILTLTQKINADGRLKEIGGAYYVSTLTNRVASASNIEMHIKLLQQFALRRSLIGVCGKGVGYGFDQNNDVFDIFATVQTELDQALKEVINHEVSNIKDIHLDIVEQSKKVYESGGVSGVVSGLKMVDNITSGWQKSDLIILAGRPSMGKTACCISMITYPAIEKNKAIAVFSLEMSKEQLVGRIQSGLSYIDVGKIVRKHLDLDEIKQIEKSCERLLTSPLYIDDTPNITLIELKAKARRLVKEKGVELIVIDYLQLMRSGLNIGSREQEIAEISRGLKGLAKELDIPIIALSQLSRLVEGRSDKKPQLSDLRESGQIEQDADMVLFCYRPEYYNIENYDIENESITTDGLFMLIVAKHRNGELGEVPLKFVHRLTKVTNHPRWVSEDIEPPVQETSTKSAIAPNNSFLEESTIQQTNEEGDILPF